MIFCLMGMSGTGKDSIKRELLKDKTLGLNLLVPYTTRPKRPGEIEGVDYYFTDNQDFAKFLEGGKVVEFREYPHYVDGNVIYYTVDDTEVDKDYLLITTPDAFVKIKEYFSQKNIGCKDLYLFVDPVIRLKRCFDRENASGGEKYKELIRRFLADEEDYPFCVMERKFGIRNFIPNNKDIETAVWLTKNDIRRTKR